MSARRQFLKSLGTGGLATALMSFEAWLEELPPSIDREAYALDPSICYLNHASIGTMPNVVREAYYQYLKICESNPARYIWGQEWDQLREKVRAKLAAFIGCEKGSIAITHNTTEGFNILAQGLHLKENEEVLFSNLNHVGASQCFRHGASINNYRQRQFEIKLEEIIHWSENEIIQYHLDQIQPNTKLLVIPHIDNMIGLRHPVQKLAKAARAKGVQYIAVDGAQSIGMIPLDLDKLGVDFYCGSPHKWLQSPKGLGIFYLQPNLIEQLQPMWVSWGQSRWQGTARIFEDYGTRDLPTLLTLGNALEFQQRIKWEDKIKHYKRLRNYTLQKCLEKGHQWFAPASWDNGASLYSIFLKGKNLEKTMERISEKGIIMRGFPQGFVRISPNMMNHKEEIDHFFELL